MNRRNFLKAAGGAVAVSALAAVGIRVDDDRQGENLWGVEFVMTDMAMSRVKDVHWRQIESIAKHDIENASGGSAVRLSKHEVPDTERRVTRIYYTAEVVPPTPKKERLLKLARQFQPDRVERAHRIHTMSGRLWYTCTQR